MKVLLLVNSVSGINNFRRAEILSQYLKKNSAYSVELLYMKKNKLYDFIAFFKKIVTQEFEIVHIFEPLFPTFPFLFLLLKYKKAKLILDSGDLQYDLSKLSQAAFHIRIYLKVSEFLAYSFVNFIIVRGYSARELISIKYKIDINKIKWIPDGVNLDYFSELDSNNLEKNFNLNGHLVIGYSAVIRKIKLGNFETVRGWELMEIGKRLLESGRLKFKLLVIGTGPGLDNLKQIAYAYQLNDHVIFTGFVSDNEYPRYLKLMDVGFYESLNDPVYSVMMPTKLVEYMASSLAILAGDLGEAKRTFNSNGLLYAPFDVKNKTIHSYINGICEAAIELYDERHLLLIMKRNSLEVAKKNYNWENIGKIYLNYLREIEMT